MARKKVFRGKNIHTGEWLYGDYHREGKTHYITKPEQYLREYAPIEFIVDEKTVGQFTGLLDKAQKPIYEGDLLMTPEVSIKLEVYFNSDRASFCLAEHTHIEGVLYGTTPLGEMFMHYPNMRVVGSILDTPELLNEKER